MVLVLTFSCCRWTSCSCKLLWVPIINFYLNLLSPFFSEALTKLVSQNVTRNYLDAYVSCHFRLEKIHHVMHIPAKNQRGPGMNSGQNPLDYIKYHLKIAPNSTIEIHLNCCFPICFPQKKRQLPTMRPTFNGQRWPSCWKAWPPGTSVSYNSSTAKRWIPAVVQSCLGGCCVTPLLLVGVKGSFIDL